jgi:hypothetical protein
MVVNLQVSYESFSDDPKSIDEHYMHRLTAELCSSITKGSDIKAEMAEGATHKGERGQSITMGLIALTFLSGGSAAALFRILKSYIEKDRSIKIKISRPNGIEYEIDANNIEPEKIVETFNKVKEVVDNYG